MDGSVGARNARLRAYVSEREQYEDRPLYVALVEVARTSGAAGATVIRGLLGFGASSREVADYDLRMSEDLPVVVEVVDERHKIEALAEVFDAMIAAGMVTVEDVTVLAYKGAASGRAEDAKDMS
ncbi:MAG: DUF190 domain-containing protein [Coriobacteriia bacterium]